MTDRKPIALPTDVLRQYEEQLAGIYSRTNQPEIPVQIGKPTDQTIYANDEKTEIYIHGFGADPSGVTTIASGGVPKDKVVYGQPILVKRMPSGAYRYVGIDVQADNIYRAGLTEEPTQEPVYLNQIRWGTIHPYIGLQVLIVSAMYGTDYVGDLLSGVFDGTATDTSSVAISVPTTNNRQKGVLIQIDPANGVLEYKQSANFSASISRTEAYRLGLLPLQDTGRYRAGYVFLKSGMTAITYGDIWETPEIFVSGSDYFPIDIDSNVTIPDNRQIVVSDFTISTGTLTVNGRIKVI